MPSKVAEFDVTEVGAAVQTFGGETVGGTMAERETSPLPYVLSLPGVPKSMAFDSKKLLIWLGDHVGYACFTRAHAPAT